MFRSYKRSYSSPYRRWYRKSSSYGKTKVSRNVKASAMNMTQGGKFTVSSQNVYSLNIPVGSNATYQGIDLASMVKGAPMHSALSNVFDQYRIEKCVIKVKDLGEVEEKIDTISYLATLFSVVDRTGISPGFSFDDLKTYSSYKETSLSGNGDVSPIHSIYLGQSTTVEKSMYFDTKAIAEFPRILLGIKLPDNVTTSSIEEGDKYYGRKVSVEVEAQIRYRGVRLDNRNYLSGIQYVDVRTYNTVNGMVTHAPVAAATDVTVATNSAITFIGNVGNNIRVYYRFNKTGADITVNVPQGFGYFTINSDLSTDYLVPVINLTDGVKFYLQDQGNGTNVYIQNVSLQ